MKQGVLLASLVFAGLMTGCATQEELTYYNMDNECLGTVERDYSVTMDTESSEVKTEKIVTCEPLAHDPFKGQKEPTAKELKADKNRK